MVLESSLEYHCLFLYHYCYYFYYVYAVSVFAKVHLWSPEDSSTQQLCVPTFLWVL